MGPRQGEHYSSYDVNGENSLNSKLVFVKALEVVLALVSSYLALASFFSSSIYDYVTRFTQWFLSSFGFTSTLNVNPSNYLPLMISLLVFIYILYNSLIGEEINTLNIFQVNLMLLMPELLSYSKLNFLNLIGYGFMLSPTREFTTVFLSSVTIMSIYTMMQFISKHRNQVKDFLSTGIDEEQLTKVYINQTALSLAFGIFSGFVIISTFYLVAFLSPFFYKSFEGVNYIYIEAGVLFSLLMISWIYILLRESNFEETPIKAHG